MDKEFAEAFKEEIEKEASTYRDRTKDDEKKKKRHFAFGGKKDKTRHGSGGYGKGEEVEREFAEAFKEEIELEERKMTDAEMAEREEIVKKLKPKLQSFKDKYGDDAKSVMYATATKQAMEEVEIDEEIFYWYIIKGDLAKGKIVYAGNEKQVKLKRHDSKFGDGHVMTKSRKMKKVGEKWKKSAGVSEEVEVDEASKLPPHLAKFFDKKGNLKPEVAARVAKGKEKLNWIDVTPKGYGPKEEFVIESTKEYAKYLEKIARDKQMSMISKSDKDKLLKIAALLDKERKEEFEITESGHTDVASAKNQVKVAKSALQKMEIELSKLPDEGSLPSWWTNKVAIAVDKLDGMADYLNTQVEEGMKPRKMKKEGAAEFMAAASAAKKEGKKKFKFGGKEYPVTIKVDIPLANEEIANSVGGGGIAGLDIGLTAKKKKEDTDKAKALRKKMVGEEVQRTTFAGKDVFIVDSETYYNCRLGKKKYGRYEKYVGNGEVGQTIREYGLKYPRRPIILQNGESGPMLFLKYGRS